MNLQIIFFKLHKAIVKGRYRFTNRKSACNLQTLPNIFIGAKKVSNKYVDVLNLFREYAKFKHSSFVSNIKLQVY